MTVSTSTSRVSYAGDGATVAFATTFPFFDDTDLRVILQDALGVETTQTLTTDYTVTGGGGATGTVTMVTAPASGETLVIQRNVPATQGVDYTAGEKFPADTHEQALDKLTMIVQQLSTSIARALVAKDTADLSGFDLTLPLSLDANKALGINSGGTGFTLLDLVVTIDSSTLIVVMSTAPTHVNGRIWIDTGTVNKLIWKQSDGTDWTTLFQIDTTGDSFLLENLSVTTAMLAANAVTAAKLDAAVNALGKQTIGMPAGGMTARSTNGAAPLMTELATNDVMVTGFDFDAATAEGCQFYAPMPKGWNESTVTFDVGWRRNGGSNNGVAWRGRARAVSNDDALDGAWGSFVTVTDSGATNDDLYVTAVSAALTIGGTPAENDLVIFEIERNPADAGDDLTVDATLLFVRVHYTIDSANDD